MSSCTALRLHLPCALPHHSPCWHCAGSLQLQVRAANEMRCVCACVTCISVGASEKEAGTVCASMPDPTCLVAGACHCVFCVFAPAPEESYRLCVRVCKTRQLSCNTLLVCADSNVWRVWVIFFLCLAAMDRPCPGNYPRYPANYTCPCIVCVQRSLAGTLFVTPCSCTAVRRVARLLARVNPPSPTKRKQAFRTRCVCIRAWRVRGEYTVSHACLCACRYW